MNKDEALKLALEALQFDSFYGTGKQEAITAIKAALEAKDEPEYYGLTKDHLWMSISKEHYDRLKPEFRMACYTTPPQRKPLTIEQPKVRTGDCLLVGVCASEGHKIQPQRTWVGLTDEVKQEWIDAMPNPPQPRHFMVLVNAIESELKEKNT